MKKISNNEIDADALQDLILRWNIDFPIDRWWRKSHGVAFNSQLHREVSFIDMFIEWQEEVIFSELNKKEEEEKYIPNSGNYMKKLKPEEQQLSDDAFNSIDLNNL